MGLGVNCRVEEPKASGAFAHAMTAEKLGPTGSEELVHLILAKFAFEGWGPRNGP